MEVHAHTHTARKKWTHYLWEFLMLFLAVFCGFLAENQREHLIEHQREKQYMRSMAEDLAADTGHISFVLNYFESKVPGIDTILTEYKSINERYSEPLVRNLPLLGGYEDLVPNDRTMQQLKNSGAMRLIRSIAISDSIAFYDKKMRDVLIAQEKLYEHSKRFYDIGELFDLRAFEPGFDKPSFGNTEKISPLLTNDKSIIGKYYIWILLYKAINSEYIDVLRNIKAQSIRLIDLLKKEYHLK
jgi:hypothetical protein